MKIRARIIWLCLISFSVFLGLIVVQMVSASRHFNTVHRGTLRSDHSHLLQLIELDRRSIDSYLYDLTFWDDFVEFMQAPDPAFADENIKESLDTYGLDAAWVFRPDMELVYSSSLLDQAQLEVFPLPGAVLATALNKSRFIHFFTHTPSGLLEVFGASIHPSDDEARVTELQGFLVLGRIWDEEQLSYISTLSEASARVILHHSEADEVVEPTGIVGVEIPLKDWEGNVIAALDFELLHGFLEEYAQQQRQHIILFALFIFVSLGMYSVCLRNWISNPLRLISLSLKKQSAEPLAALNPRHLEYVEIAANITRNLRHQDELREARDQADHANQSKNSFLRNLSHEFKTPLNGIIGASQLLEETELSNEQKEYSVIINDSADNLNILISGLLMLIQVERGGYEVVEDPFDLSSIMHGLAEYGEQKAKTCGLSFSVDYDEDEFPSVLLGDSSSVQEVLLQLLRNAFKFTHQGRVSIRAELVESDVKHVKIRFSVDDTGIGISPKFQHSLMEAFVQGDDSQTRAYGGLGIGLSLVRVLTQSMNGQFSVTSEEGQGASFCVEFSIRRVSV